jgi:hypothetical protein
MQSPGPSTRASVSSWKRSRAAPASTSTHSPSGWVPESRWARLTPRDDPLDAQAGPGQQRIDAFGGAGIGKRREQVHVPAPDSAQGTAASTPATARLHPA